MVLNNQISPLRRDWSCFSFASVPQTSGVLFEEVTLDQRIGPEAVALLIDESPDELLARRDLTLNLKAGIASTDHGPVLFLIWWAPPYRNGRPFAFYEQLMNPIKPLTGEILERLAGQTHLHVLLTAFQFDAIRTAVEGARVSWQGSADFALAKLAYQRDYDIDDLLAGRYDRGRGGSLPETGHEKLSPHKPGHQPPRPTTTRSLSLVARISKLFSRSTPN